MPILILDMFVAVSQNAISVERRIVTVDDPAVVRVLGKTERYSSPAAWGLGVNQAYFACAFASQAEMRQRRGFARLGSWQGKLLFALKVMPYKD